MSSSLSIISSQKLAAGEAKDMVVRFVVDPQLPRKVETITLSYSFFNAEKYAKGADRVEDPRRGAGS